MKSGWKNNLHYNLFNNDETLSFESKYETDKYIPGFSLVGLIGWDDFILTKDNKYYTIPTVPLDLKYLKEIKTLDITDLEPEKTNNNRIKWYVKPLILGGNPQVKENIVWIDFSQHVEYVNFWNKKYYENKSNQK